MRIIAPPENTAGILGYTSRELRRIFREHLNIELPPCRSAGDLRDDMDAIVLGTPGRLRRVAAIARCRLFDGANGGAGICDARRSAPLAAGPLVAGNCRHGPPPACSMLLRDLEHYHLGAFRNSGGRLIAEPFTREDYPRITYRGHWNWGCNMPDKTGWIENMSRWKLNELIHWDNYPPEKAREYVAFAHERGVRVIWGFGWGWIPEWNFHPAGGLRPRSRRWRGDVRQ